MRPGRRSVTEGPPAIPGLDFRGELGAGGYADVYLYEQRMPRRLVAVKVLRDAVSPDVVARFSAEANAMARLEHPHIVPVYAAGLTGDDRPYLTMMYYPLPNLAERARAGSMPVDEVLRIGVQVAGAVETAHAAGLLHRDIKPANILTSQYGAPGLADFGIAARVAEAQDDEPGITVPWSPPETLFGRAAADVRTDVYALAATLWTLLAGRSPFEAPGGDNAAAALMTRIRDHPPPTTGRPDVPARLEELLHAAMAKEPEARPASALRFALALQGVESQLGLPRTDLTVAAPAPSVVGEADRAVVARHAGRVPAPAAPGDGGPALGRPRLPPWAVVVAVLVALLAAVSSARLITRPDPATPIATASPAGVPAPRRDAASRIIITATRSGDLLTFTWTYPGRAAADTYRVRAGGRIVTAARPTVDVRSPGRACISVQVVGAKGRPVTGFSREGCAA